MQFSIVIPVYNVAAYLEGCVDSVLANNCINSEIILVDDGSTDGLCPQLCDRLAQKHSRLIRVVHQENRGLGGARNAGIEAAAGDYLLFLDSDDTITPDTLDTLRAAIVQYGSPEIISFHTALVPEGEGQTAYRYHTLPVGVCHTLSSLPSMLMDPPLVCAKLWSRDLFVRTGIRFPDRLLYEDLCTTGKLLLDAKSVVGIDAVCYLYLQRTGSIMRSADADRCREIMVVLDSVLGYFREKGQFDTYRRELAAMTVGHIYYACYRVMRIDPKHPLLKELPAYLDKNFPEHKDDPYYNRALTRAQRLIFRLIRRGHAPLCNRLFGLKDKL